MRILSSAYESLYRSLLADLGAEPALPAKLLMTFFWPMIGYRFDSDLLIVGRAVNGWVNEITVEQALSPDIVGQRVLEARSHAELDGMRWVTALAGNREGYNTNQSAFWRVVRRVSTPDDASDERRSIWPAYTAWSNLYKAAPAEGWNPGGRFMAAQTSRGSALLEQELADLAPRRVLALTGRSWFEPFARSLGLGVDWRTGLVEGVAVKDGRPWVVAKHPMGKPEGRLVEDVLAAFDDLRSVR